MSQGEAQGLALPPQGLGEQGLQTAWEALVRDAGAAILIADRQGKIEYANEAATTGPDGQSVAVAGRLYQDVLPKSIARERLAFIGQALSEKKALVVEHIVLGVCRRTSFRPFAINGKGRVLITCRTSSPAEARRVGPGETYVRARFDDLGPLQGLTRRELDILGHIGQGLSTAEIAKKLHRSVKTVEWHRVSLGNKLGASNRVELARIAIRAGLVDTKPLQEDAGSAS